ncbi:hypothetical protein GCM10027449_14310 [Sinomonas notoginsengisoli]
MVRGQGGALISALWGGDLLSAVKLDRVALRRTSELESPENLQLYETPARPLPTRPRKPPHQGPRCLGKVS